MNDFLMTKWAWKFFVQEKKKKKCCGRKLSKPLVLLDVEWVEEAGNLSGLFPSFKVTSRNLNAIWNGLNFKLNNGKTTRIRESGKLIWLAAACQPSKMPRQTPLVANSRPIFRSLDQFTYLQRPCSKALWVHPCWKPSCDTQMMELIWVELDQLQCSHLFWKHRFSGIKV